MINVINPPKARPTATDEAAPTSPSEIPTPALLIDGAAARRNLTRMAAYTAQHGLGLRPHIKTHKSLKVAVLQLEAGAVGLTAAKVGEAEVMAAVGDDIMVAYPAIDGPRRRRLANLARTKRIRVAVDTAAAIEALASAAVAAGSSLGILIEMDAGFARTGVATPADTLALAQQVARTAGVTLDGLLCYPGHMWAPAAEQGPFLAALSARIDEALALWTRDGLEAKIVAGGSTPTAYQSHLLTSCTEIHPGTYVYNDMNTFRGGFCELADCAARIACTVVSDAVKNQIIIDGGTKTFTSDLCAPARDSGHGYVVEYPEAKIKRLSEEHGWVDVSLCARRPAVGERVTVVPNHICPCVNLQDAFWWIEAGQAPERLPVDARGLLS